MKSIYLQIVAILLIGVTRAISQDIVWHQKFDAHGWTDYWDIKESNNGTIFLLGGQQTSVIPMGEPTIVHALSNGSVLFRQTIFTSTKEKIIIANRLDIDSSGTFSLFGEYAAIIPGFGYKYLPFKSLYNSSAQLLDSDILSLPKDSALGVGIPVPKHLLLRNGTLFRYRQEIGSLSYWKGTPPNHYQVFSSKTLQNLSNVYHRVDTSNLVRYVEVIELKNGTLAESGMLEANASSLTKKLYVRTLDRTDFKGDRYILKDSISSFGKVIESKNNMILGSFVVPGQAKATYVGSIIEFDTLGVTHKRFDLGNVFIFDIVQAPLGYIAVGTQISSDTTRRECIIALDTNLQERWRWLPLTFNKSGTLSKVIHRKNGAFVAAGLSGTETESFGTALEFYDSPSTSVDFDNQQTLPYSISSDNYSFTFNLRQDVPLHYTIFNNLGERVAEEKTLTHSNTISLEDYQSGAYFIHVSCNNTTATHPILICK